MRLKQIDGLRALAVVSVIVHHTMKIPMLWAGVDQFFVISGFLITGVLLDRKERQVSYYSYFWSRRAKRILPPLGMLLLLFTLSFGTGWLHFWYLYAFFAMNLGFFLHAPMPLSHLWSLAVEEQFYLAWPFVVKICKLKGVLLLACLLMLAAPLCRALVPPTMVYRLTPCRMDTLAAGAILAYVWRLHREWFIRSHRYAYAAGAVALALLAVIATVDKRRGTGIHSPMESVLLYEGTMLLAVAVLTLALGEQKWFKQALCVRPLVYVGTISYSMYLIHYLIWKLIHFQTGITSLLVVVATSLGYAALSSELKLG